MRTCFAFVFMLLFLSSCDDGDIIVTTLDFDNPELEMCGVERNKVLYFIKNEEVFETISLKFSNPRISPQDGILTTDSTQTITFELNESNQVIYRTYDATVPQNYFCSDIPPSSPRVLEEFKSVGGTVTITTISQPVNELDHDGDGIPSLLEGILTEQDTDGDGIPDYLDIDDDGDNVPTKTEIANAGGSPTNPEYPDTDGDGIPDYLDPDDDGDGVPTKLEITVEFQNPRAPQNQNEAGEYRYLYPLVAERFEGTLEFTLDNTISRRYLSSIVITNLQLQNQGGNNEEISFEIYRLGTFSSSSVNISLPANTED
ncbi:MAG: hypothetical protein R6U03_12170 [Gillisia sp.]